MNATWVLKTNQAIDATEETCSIWAAELNEKNNLGFIFCNFDDSHLHCYD